MKNTYEIRPENGVFSVYKNGVFVKSFRTLKEAEDFIKRQQKKEHENTPKPKKPVRKR